MWILLHIQCMHAVLRYVWIFDEEYKLLLRRNLYCRCHKFWKSWPLSNYYIQIERFTLHIVTRIALKRKNGCKKYCGWGASIPYLLVWYCYLSVTNWHSVWVGGGQTLWCIEAIWHLIWTGSPLTQTRGLLGGGGWTYSHIYMFTLHVVTLLSIVSVFMQCAVCRPCPLQTPVNTTCQ